jgi:hypothetical protein
MCKRELPYAWDMQPTFSNIISATNCVSNFETFSHYIQENV